MPTCCGNIGIAIGQLPWGCLGDDISYYRAESLLPELLCFFCLLQLLLQFLSLISRGCSQQKQHAKHGGTPPRLHLYCSLPVQKDSAV